ncbi:hypothetical protein PTSG_12810 [Salpingoeca rosetta]|uniref:Ubiquitin-activating enzyme SCCH domain-containing protein n=1 Tax=Salpingoeca rosetta (strain ATCC 50818 / BSB-021) TaxID=946362 RepID=F2ULQ0_SALR5|nr:uncharacterized protein PTSG_12810 [Salpingoeca rosetta]EGD78049.1 hypothetical protein PTSG_12810 [Salpingoeca rosetta]|eukprot:XP_004989725.1 hypothetical protein PTSG_12810 [Salpingoeca rosetta]
MGTGANVDVIVPHTINSYSDGGDAEAGGGIPLCTLRNFPQLIDHCIEWARAKFTDLFVSPASQLQQFLEDPEGFISGLETKIEQHVGGERIGALERGVDMLKAIKDLAAELQEKPTMETCVSLAWRDFHAFFRHVILDLIATFLAEAKTKSGEPFWSGHKIFPEVLEFDPQNPLHNEFLIAAANIYACVFKVHPTKYPSEENKLHIKRTSLPRTSRTSSSQADTHSHSRLSEASWQLSFCGGYSYVNTSPDGRLLVAESLTCKQRIPVTATDMVHLPLLASYSRVYICGLGVREAERTIIFEDPFLGAELACAAASGGVIERWQKEPYECKLHRVLDLKCLAVVPSTFEHTRCMAVTPTLYIAGNKAGVISLWQLGQPSTLLAEWRADAVDNDKEVVQDMDEEEASGEVEAETASKERVRTAVDALLTPDGRFLHPHITRSAQHNMKGQQQWLQQQQQKQQRQQQRHAPVSFADSSNKLASACGNTVHVCAIDHHHHHHQQQRQHDQQQQQQQQQERQHLLAIDTARGDVFVCDVADHKVLSKLKVSRNVPVKFGVFARRSSILFVNSVESVIKPQMPPLRHVPIVVPPATPPADTQMLDDYDVTALPNVPDIICQAS